MTGSSVAWPESRRLCLVTDRELMQGRSIETVIAAAIRGGVGIVQLREKTCATREFVELARRVRALLEGSGVPLLINDRVDVALAAGADGVHVGQNDMMVADVRRLMGARAIIGLSVETMQQVTEAEEYAVDYLGVSPVYSTPTKLDTITEWGLNGLRRLQSVSHHPLIAIGGINSENAAGVIKAGASGIAVVSAICAAADPESAARKLRQMVSPAGHPEQTILE